MTDEEALEILDHNWTRLVNSDYTDIELGQAQDTAIKALEVIKKLKKAYAEFGAILCDAYDADVVKASGFAGYKQCCDNCGTGLQYCELDNRDRFRFCGNWTPKVDVG